MTSYVNVSKPVKTLQTKKRGVSSLFKATSSEKQRCRCLNSHEKEEEIELA